MAQNKPLIKVIYPVYTQKELNRILDASRKLDLTGEDLIREALSEYLTKKGF